MSNISFGGESKHAGLLQPLPLSALIYIGLATLLVTLQFSCALPIAAGIGIIALRFHQTIGAIASSISSCVGSLGSRGIGISVGVMLFVAITIHADPALAQLFDTAQSQVESIFGQYLDTGIIVFLFGLIRVVVWIAAVGFVFFAVYQAQRGEQWQPLAQNAFIVVAAVVLVEGLSTLFFGS